MGRYLMYAIGEVALVIIGIMIAVWLNNLNEARTQDEKIQAILKQIQEELTLTVEDANDFIEYYRVRDSLIYLAMNDKLTREDYEDRRNIGLMFINNSYFDLVMQNDGFNNLMRKSEIMPDKYLPLVKGLKQLYINTKEPIDSFNDEIKEVVNVNIDRQLNHDWGPDYFFNQKLSSDAIDYFLEDVNYRKGLFKYSVIGIGNLGQNVITARIDAIKYIREIDALLGESNNYSFDVNTSDYELWIGQYHNEILSDTIHVKSDEAGMKWNGFDKEWVEIYPLGNSKFHFDSPAFVNFNKDEDDKIEGFTLSVMNQNYAYIKIDE